MPGQILHLAACFLCIGVFVANARAADFKTVFPIPGLNDGAAPVSALIKIGAAYFGTAPMGGDFGGGTVFTIDAATGRETTLHSFAGGRDGSGPSAPMIAFKGKLYGTTPTGGAAGAGTVFEIDPASGTETILHSFAGFPGDATPLAPLVAFNGSLYGTTASGGASEDGTIFKIDPATGAETSLYNFGAAGSTDGAFPHAGMIVVGSALYGTTEEGGTAGIGTIFRFDPDTNTEATQHALSNTDGIIPEAPLSDLNGLLYGTASQGGVNNHGTIFSFDPASTKLTVLHAFSGGADGAFPEAGLITIGSTLYGTSTGFNTNGFGSVFALDSSNGKFASLYSFTGVYDGAQPASELLADGGHLIGVAQAGGFNNNGVAFSVDPTTSAGAVLHSFSGSDSNSTTSALIKAGHTLYGSATGGGAFGYGAIIQVDAKTGAGAVTYSFKGGADGTNPTGMLAASGGALYGTTKLGGTANFGTVFKLDAQNVRTTLHDFAGGSDGSQPHGGLLALGPLLYGTTYDGGTAGSGTLFAIDPATGVETLLYNFTGGADGALPWAPLIAVNGTLYGTTLNGGNKHNGVVFSYDIASGRETTLHAFTGGADGSAPFSPVTSVGGLLYGTTSGFGSPINGGTVFSLDPATGVETVLHVFKHRHGGQMPLGGVIERGGKLYGTTLDGSLGFGTVFSLDLATGAEKALYAFTGGADSGLSEASLLQVGKFLWGTTLAVSGNAGTVFKVKP